jgi:hypothetical protein
VVSQSRNIVAEAFGGAMGVSFKIRKQKETGTDCAKRGQWFLRFSILKETPSLDRLFERGMVLLQSGSFAMMSFLFFIICAR